MIYRLILLLLLSLTLLEAKNGELRLMFQAFSYSGDNESAYQTAKIGYKQNPKSLYWNKKLAMAARWTNRGDEAVSHMMFIYKETEDKELESDLIKYGMTNYQYKMVEPLVVNKASKNPSKKNIRELIKLYDYLGTPKKAAKYLENAYKKDKTKTKYLTYILKIYMETGDLQSAKRTMGEIKRRKSYDSKNSRYMAWYYYIKRDLEKTYEHIMLATNIEEDDYRYYEIVSDVSWYLQKYKEGAKASLVLMQKKQARIVDYERIVRVYSKKNPELVAEASKKAYSKNKANYLFYSYANSMIELGEYKQLDATIQDIDRSDSQIKTQAMYWMIKAEVDKHFKREPEYKEDLRQARRLDPHNVDIITTLLWLYMESGNQNELRLLLKILEDDPKSASELYMPMASAYYNLQEVDKAALYLDRLKRLDAQETQTIDYKFLQAYIAQSRDNEYLFNKYIYEISDMLDKQAIENPSLKENKDYLSYYFRAAIFIKPADEFLEELRLSKSTLGEQEYLDIAYSFSVKHSAKEQSKEIFQKIENKEAWLKFSNALMFDNRSSINGLFDAYLESLSLNDVVQAASITNQDTLADTMAFKSTKQNSQSQTAYLGHLNLQKENSQTDIKVARRLRDPLLQYYTKVEDTTNLLKGFKLNSKFHYYTNETIDSSIIKSVPSTTLLAGLGIKKEFNNSYIEVDASYNDNMQEYMSYKIKFYSQIHKSVKMDISYEKNSRSQESTAMWLSGLKDVYKIQAMWNLLNSFALNFNYEAQEFNSQDGVYLGSGDYARINATKTVRSGYPDLSVGSFYDLGLYDETSGSRGVIDEIQGSGLKALPNDFYNVGLSVDYGMSAKNSYSRTWRPYFSVSSYYNGDTNAFNYSTAIGTGAKVWHQDHLDIGASYSQSVRGNNDDIFELFLHYKFLH